MVGVGLARKPWRLVCSKCSLTFLNIPFFLFFSMLQWSTSLYNSRYYLGMKPVSPGTSCNMMSLFYSAVTKQLWHLCEIAQWVVLGSFQLLPTQGNIQGVYAARRQICQLLRCIPRTSRTSLSWHSWNHCSGIALVLHRIVQQQIAGTDLNLVQFYSVSKLFS